MLESWDTLTHQVGSVTHDVAVRVAVGPRGGVYVVGQLGLDDAPLAAAPAFLGRWDYLGKHYKHYHIQYTLFTCC
jgi:hypothetical protein